MIDEALERRLEIWLARLLRYGSYLGCSVIGLGLLLAWFNIHGLEAHWGSSIVSAGIGLLITLPIARLAVMLVTFVTERDYRFAFAAAIVLIIIALGFAVGLSSKA
jgi:Protein of unknown function (DUF1634)